MVPAGFDAPEQRARQKIDAALLASGWVVQNRDEMNLSAGRGVAIREFKLAHGHGFADYLLFVDGRAAGVVEAKAEGLTLTGGIRHDSHDTFGQHTLGQASAAWALNDGATIVRASFGQGFKAPTLYQ